jgi:exopolysaccharide biosynthesis polyprenyl glycosylphosphotransferase
LRELEYADEVQGTQNVLNLHVSPAAAAGAFGGGQEIQPSRRDPAIFFLIADLVFVVASALLATFSRFSMVDAGEKLSNEIGIVKHFGFLAFYAGALILSCHVYKVHVGKGIRSSRHEQLAVLKAVGVATLLVTACIYLSGAKVISRLVVGETVVLSTMAMLGSRFLLGKRAVGGVECRNVLIVSADAVGRDLEKHLSGNQDLGFAVKGYLDRRRNGMCAYHPERRVGKKDPKILGAIEDLPRVIRSNFIDEIFITTPEDRELVKRLISEARRNGIDARVVPDLYDGLASAAPIEYLGAIPIMSVCRQSGPVVGLIMKRWIDILLATPALIVLSPVLVLVALLIKLSSPGPVLYRSTRIGKKGRRFVCYKFRTMVANADELRDGLHHLNEREDILFKIANDPRVTRVGRFLRKYSIDELPQFLNVLIGDMSLVGPRPGIPSEYQQYALEHLRRLDVVPGITGLWQVAARKDSSFQSYITLDTYYVNHWSVWLDCKILFRTIAVVFAGTGQ